MNNKVKEKQLIINRLKSKPDQRAYSGTIDNVEIYIRKVEDKYRYELALYETDPLKVSKYRKSLDKTLIKAQKYIKKHIDGTESN